MSQPAYITYINQKGQLTRHRVLVVNDSFVRCHCGFEEPIPAIDQFHDEADPEWARASLCTTCHRDVGRPWETPRR